MSWIRGFQFFSYFILGLLTIIIGAIFLYRLRKYMYLYFEDFKKKTILNILGLFLYICVCEVHISRELYMAMKDNLNISDVERYLVYSIL